MEVADTFTGLVVGYAVIIYRGVEVAESVMVLVVDGKEVIKNRGVEVALAVVVWLAVAVSVAVAVCDAVSVAVAVCVPVFVAVNDEVTVGVDVDVGGSAEGLTDAASLPTVMSTPHTWGRVRVAEYVQVGFSFTPLIARVAPHARVRWNSRQQDPEQVAGPYF